MREGGHKGRSKGRGMNPELRRQLAEAERTGTEAQAVFVMRPREAEPLPPEEAESLANDLIARAEASTGHKRSDLHVFRNLSSFVVQGPAELLRQLAEDEQVESAMPNRPSGSMRIEPPAPKRRT